jgi:hypothetical protein
MATPQDTPDNASRASIDSNSRDGFNRIRIPTDLKSQIYSQIADSSESLPYEDSSDDESDFKVAPQGVAAQAPLQGSAQSKLSQSLLSSDLPTPTPERPNPLEQVPTARDTTNQDEPSPVRSHERGATHTKPLAPRVGDLIGDEDSGEDMSRQSTATSKNSGEGKRPKLGGRPSTMKRIGSAIKKTMSNNKHE